MWDVFSLPYLCNEDNKWDLLLLQYIFSLEYVKLHINSLQKGFKVDLYVVENLTWSGV